MKKKLKSDLDLIIDFYEAEKQVLEQAVNDALAELDYELVINAEKL